MRFIIDYLPSPVKTLYSKLKWFVTHYGEIGRFSLVDKSHYHGPVTYDTDGLTTSSNCDFITEPRFAKAYRAAAATQPWEGFTLQWRVYIVCWFADHVHRLPGDFVECGVNTGAYARAVIDYVDFGALGKTFYLLDTFEGFPEGQMTEEERAAGIAKYEGDHYKNVYQQVVETFSGFPVKIIKGRVPDTLSQCAATSIAYLSIDMNAAAPEIAAADYFWPKLVSGGVMVLDDYGFPVHINQKIAFDKFAAKNGVSVLSLPTGQGIILKP